MNAPGFRRFSAPVSLRPALLALGVAALLPGCITHRIEVKKEGPRRQQQWARICKDSALMSALAYRDPKVPLGELRPPAKCDLNQSMTEAEQHACYAARLKHEGWRLRGTCERGEKDEGRGLYFDVWQNDTVSPRRIVFSFRGTHGGPDWGANLRWFRFFGHPGRDHYDIAREESVPVIEKLWQEDSKRRPVISTTGHSLGGGLAQQVLYAAADKVYFCIALDPSPVTAWKDLKTPVQMRYRGLANRSEFAQYRIVRAYADGEILSYARGALLPFYKEDTLTRSVEFDVQGSTTAIGRHSMNLLANRIVELAEQPIPPQSTLEFVPTPPKPSYRYHETPEFQTAER